MDINLRQIHTRHKVLHLFLIIFLGCSAAVVAVASLFYHQERTLHFDAIRSAEQSTIDLQSIAIGDEFDIIVSDLLFLSRQNELLNSFDDPASAPDSGMENEYMELALAKRMYNQIRFLDTTGMELARVNFQDETVNIVGQAALQNKKDRYYFSDSIALDEREIYVSDFDLNIEHGRIETPIKPMIRFGTPVFDRQGTKQGVVILNYLGNQLLNRIRNSGDTDQTKKMLLNSNGYWLLSPDKDHEWGFMYPDRQDDTFGNLYPAEWAIMIEEGKGQVMTDNGLFTFKTISPVKIGRRVSMGNTSQPTPATIAECSSGLFWVLVSHVPSGVLEDYPKTLKGKLILANIGLLLALAFGIWQLAKAITKRKIYQQHLLRMAMYDSLTELPNRKMFFDQLTKGLDTAARYDRLLGLLYIDLDGFKNVNDTLGHEAGDDLLIQVGARMKQCVRKSDIVARLGGDEFSIVLPEITDETGAMTAGDKIINSLSRPFTISGKEVLIGASIGAAIYPADSTTAEGLIQLADQAMYQAKAQGKNTCVRASAAEAH